MTYVASLAATILSIVLRGFVLAALWEWFVVPLGAPHLTPTHAIGISALVAYLTIDLSVKREKLSSGVIAFTGSFVSVFVLAFGYIVHRIMIA